MGKYFGWVGGEENILDKMSCESKRQWPNLASTYQDAKVRSD